MHMQAKGTTDYKSGFTFAFEQLLNVRANKPHRAGRCEGCWSVADELCTFRKSELTRWSYVPSLRYVLPRSLSNPIIKNKIMVIKQR